MQVPLDRNYTFSTDRSVTGHNCQIQLEIINVVGNIKDCHTAGIVHCHGDTHHFTTQSKQGTNMEGERRDCKKKKKENIIIYMTH